MTEHTYDETPLERAYRLGEGCGGLDAAGVKELVEMSKRNAESNERRETTRAQRITCCDSARVTGGAYHAPDCAEILDDDDDDDDEHLGDERMQAWIAETCVTLTLPRADVQGIADALALFASIDEGEYTDYDDLIRLSKLLNAAAREGLEQT